MFFNAMMYDGITSNPNVDLQPVNEAFKLGNSFKKEYKGYKNYKENTIVANDEKGFLLLRIYEIDFYINDLNLYLDLHPEDTNVYHIFKEYTEKLKNLIDNYEIKYGPLELCDSEYESYMWYKGKWPFEGGNL